MVLSSILDECAGLFLYSLSQPVFVFSLWTQTCFLLVVALWKLQQCLVSSFVGVGAGPDECCCVVCVWRVSFLCLGICVLLVGLPGGSLAAVVVVVIHFCSLLRDKCVHLSSLCSALMKLVNLILNRSVSAGLVNWIAVVMIFLRCLHQTSVRANSVSKAFFFL